MIQHLRESLYKFEPNREVLTRNQLIVFAVIIFLTLILKFFLIPFNMIDHGEGATRTWNAYWWSLHPFFIEPLSGNPGWFYFVGPVLMITGEIFYTPIIAMMFSVTVGGIYIFKLAVILANYKTALIAYLLLTFSPAIFRLNYTPVPQQLYLAALCIMLYYFVRAMLDKEGKSRKYFIIAGVFSFIGLSFRPEALFVLVPFCLIALIIPKKGRYEFIVLALLFQVIWMCVSWVTYGSLFKTFQAVREYDYIVGSQLEDQAFLLKLKGFFLPYYFMVMGMTVFVFCFFAAGIITSYRKFPLLLFTAVFIPVIVPALVNGISGTMSNQYHTTRYFYSTFYYGSLFAAIGTDTFIKRYKSSYAQWSFTALLILTAIPLSYIKEFVPQKFKNLFPKVVEFTVTSENPADARELVKFIDKYIKEFPALIFDSEGSDSSILYVPFRTKLAPPDRVLISGYNVPVTKTGLEDKIAGFINTNPRAIVMVKKENTLMNSIFNDDAWKEKNSLKMKFEEDTRNWKIYTYTK